MGCEGGGVALIIPARLGATRFPGKLLERAAGRSILEWTWRRARAAAGPQRVWIATDSDPIAREAGRFGGVVIRTGEHPSGTDRVAEAADRIQPAPRWVVNLQGDEPLIDPSVIGAVCEELQRSDEAVVTCSAPLTAYREWIDPAVVKVVCDRNREALYFSRAPIPSTPRGATPDAFADVRAVARVHVGIYGFPAPLLRRMVGEERAPLERIESLEQLRLLETGVRIRVVPVARRSVAVDVPEDLERVRPLLEQEASAGEDEAGASNQGRQG